MATIRKPFKATTAAAALWNPWVGTGSLERYGGVPLGPDRRTGALVTFDPWMLKTEGLIDATIFEVNGKRGFGKTALLTSLTPRLMKLQAGHNEGMPHEMRAQLDSRKLENGIAEFGELAKYLESTVYSVNRAASINLFDPSMGLTELDLVEVAVNACETAKSGELTGFEPLALQVAMNKMLTTVYGSSTQIVAPELLESMLRSLTLEDAKAYFKNMSRSIAARLVKEIESLGISEQLLVYEQLKIQFELPINLPESEFVSAAAHVSGYLNRILRGDFGNIFGGTGSLRDILCQPMVVWDWTGVNEKARTLLASLRHKWNTVALQNNDLELIPHIRVSDEEHEAFKNLMYVRFYSEYVKKARAYWTADFRSTQFETDLLMHQEGSEISRLSEGIIRGISGMFVTRQPNDDDILHRFTQRGLSDLDAHYLTEMEVGTFGIILPGRPMIVYQHYLNTIEYELAKSDAAAKFMVNRVPVLSVPGMLERSHKIGLIQVGMN